MVFYIVIPLRKLLLTLVKAQLQFQEKFVSVQYQATNVTHTKILIGAYTGLIALYIIYVRTSLIVLNNAALASYAINYALILLRIFVKNFLFHLMCAMDALMSISVF